MLFEPEMDSTDEESLIYEDLQEDEHEDADNVEKHWCSFTWKHFNLLIYY